MYIQLRLAKSRGAEVGLHFLNEPTNDLDIATLQLLEEKMERWMYLEDLAARIGEQQ